MPNFTTIIKTSLQVILVVMIASLLSLYMNKGSYFADNFILGKLTIVESQENMGDIYNKGFYGEKRDVDKAIEWYGDPLLYWENYRDTYSDKEIKIILNMFDKMASLLIHREDESDINNAVILYRLVLKSGHISKKGLKFLWDRRDEKKYSSLMQEEDFKKKLFLDADNSVNTDRWLYDFSHTFPSYDYGYDYSEKYTAPVSQAPWLKKICWDEGDEDFEGNSVLVCGTKLDKERAKQKQVTTPSQVTQITIPTQEEDPMMEINNQRREYVSTLANRIKSNWVYKGSQEGWSCDMYILQNKKGEIQSSNIQLCQVTNKSKLKSFKKSLERAILKSSPLPQPDNEEIFEREILLKFKVQ
jgi:tRNA splicing endonuclease